MFERQWFSAGSQIGLTNEAVQFEMLLRKRELNEAHRVLNETALNENRYYWQRMKMRLAALEERYKNPILKKKLSIYWAGFWPDFDIYDNQLLDFFRFALPSQNVRTTEDIKSANITMCSCYGDLHPISANSAAKRILFLGENIRPSYTDFDLSMSFDKPDYRGRNIHLPLWMLEIDWFKRGKSYSDRIVHPITLFTEPRNIEYCKRTPSIVFVGNNCEPFRKSIIEYLNDCSSLNVDHYGSQHKPIDDKIALLAKYRLTLAMENSSYPGYVTEKAIHAYLAGTQAIYWGDSTLCSFIKEHTLFTLIKTDDSLEKIEEICHSLLTDETCRTIEPLFDKKILMNEFFEVLAKIASYLREYLH